MGIGVVVKVSPNSGDWRLAVQHNYLRGLAWTWKSYRKLRPGWDHDHCAFCWAKFLEGTSETLSEGYASSDDYYCVCRPYFDDFREMFRWTGVA